MPSQRESLSATSTWRSFRFHRRSSKTTRNRLKAWTEWHELQQMFRFSITAQQPTLKKASCSSCPSGENPFTTETWRHEGFYISLQLRRGFKTMKSMKLHERLRAFARDYPYKPHTWGLCYTQKFHEVLCVSWLDYSATLSNTDLVKLVGRREWR